MTKENKYNICYHCGEECRDVDIEKDGKHFCCKGCEFVFDMLNSSDLDDYYEKFGNTGLSLKNSKKADFSFLDDPNMKETLLQYEIENESKVTVYLPQIYCSACIWLIENLHKLNSAIIESRVNFLKKEAAIRFDNTKITLRGVFELLHGIGYTPLLNLSDSEKKTQDTEYKKLWIKVGIAGFAFGNLMLFALPDYLSPGGLDEYFQSFLGYLNVFLSFFVLYAGSDYFLSAFNSLKVRHINIDVPISLGILILFVRSIYEIFSGTGLGYVDSMSGLVFFLLLGKVFQKQTYHNIVFDRDFKSYFPISVLRKKNGIEESVPVNNVIVGDILVIRNNEIIPTDSILLSSTANFDYSFITGESTPVSVKQSGKIYAGAKVIGASIEVEVKKKFHSGYLIELWNSKISENQGRSKVSQISNVVAKYFTVTVLLVAFAAFAYWFCFNDINKAINAFTAVLIIACPCAIALSIPFSFGTAMRIFSRNNFFIKNDGLIENLAKLTHIVFDKTGTLTKPDAKGLQQKGKELTQEEKQIIKSVVRNSTHPYSRMISNFLKVDEVYEIDSFVESPGMGIEAVYNEHEVRIGRIDWVKEGFVRVDDSVVDINLFLKNKESTIAVAIDRELVAVFVVKSIFRTFLKELFSKLSQKFEISIISGDSKKDAEELNKLAGDNVDMLFNRMPSEKVSYIERLQQEGDIVMMTGDGLNDAGALQQANFGLAVSEDISGFSPACDGIIMSNSLEQLPAFLQLSKLSLRTVIYSYIISFLYNIIGFGFAVQGTLSPVIAAILMPISSVSVVLFATGKVLFHGKRLKLK